MKAEEVEIKRARRKKVTTEPMPPKCCKCSDPLPIDNINRAYRHTVIGPMCEECFSKYVRDVRPCEECWCYCVDGCECRTRQCWKCDCDYSQAEEEEDDDE